MEITRHFTATVLVVHNGRVLLHKHKKSGALLPVGGHLERDELPQEAALREVKEEAGLEVVLYVPEPRDFVDARPLINPVHTLLIDMNPYHQHIDLIFYATAKTANFSPEQGESTHLNWYTCEDVLTTEMPENVRRLALEALELLG